MRLRLPLGVALALALWAAPATAQSATLLADTVRIDGNARLIAEGNVQVAHDGALLTASRVTYDRRADRLRIDGPITLDDGGRSVLLADSAALDPGLRNGLLRSARLVLDRQLQLAAAQIARAGGRYTQLSNAVASSCEVCAGNPTPTWEIRAAKVIYDRQERLLYFDRASFRLFGVPVAYLPRLRLPDPERRRASGVLIPRLASNSQLGVGAKIPYFAALGDHADLTLTPYLSNRTATLEARYRQALGFGAMNLQGAISRDEIRPDATRWYLFGEAAFRLPRGFRMEIDLEEVSDAAYLVDYDYSDKDRLRSEMRLLRVRRDALFRAGLTDYTTLREDEIAIEDELPSRVADVIFERRLDMPAGALRLGFDASALTRASRADGDGRDVSEIGVSADWMRRRVAGPGLVWQTRARIDGALYATRDDSRFDRIAPRLTGAVATELRLPLQRTGPAGGHHLIEPVVQLAYARASSDEVPNEDGLLVEFDEGNLFALNRFPGDDVTESGLRANLGIGYTARMPDGTGIGLTLGRVFRLADEPAFGAASGLRGERSDWLAAGRLSFGTSFDLIARSVFDSGFDAEKTEARLAYAAGGYGLAGSYVWLEAEPRENRFRDTHELIVDGNARLSRHWLGSFDARYDFNQDRTAEAGIGLTYRTECLEVELTVNRRFTETASIEPSTSVGFTVSLAGFGRGRYDETYRKTCNG